MDPDDYEVIDVEGFDMVDSFTADDRGRITLGSEWANKRVRVFVEDLRVDPMDVVKPDDETVAVLSDMARWATENGYTPMGYRPGPGKILSTDAEWIDTPYGLDAEAEA